MKTCSKCGFTCDANIAGEFFHHSLELPGGLASQCTECKRAAQRAYERKNSSKRGEYKRRYERDKAKARDLKRKIEAFEKYGGVRCACCGVTEPIFLTIDHVDGGGAVHRREAGIKGGRNLYQLLKREGYPPGFQVLCFNCNFAKHVLGVCPHEFE